MHRWTCAPAALVVAVCALIAACGGAQQTSVDSSTPRHDERAPSPSPPPAETPMPAAVPVEPAPAEAAPAPAAPAAEPVPAEANDETPTPDPVCDPLADHVLSIEMAAPNVWVVVDGKRRPAGTVSWTGKEIDARRAFIVNECKSMSAKKRRCVRAAKSRKRLGACHAPFAPLEPSAPPDVVAP